MPTQNSSGEPLWQTYSTKRASIVGSNRVLRGGDWDSFGLDCRSANRNRTDPGDRIIFIGFRLVFVP